MKLGFYALSIIAMSHIANLAFAEDKAKEQAGHCEKVDADGKTSDIEATDKKDCKAKGGKWNKAKKGEHGHDHKDGDGHSE